MPRDAVSPLGLLLRLLVALLVVYGTWNPYGVSFYHWAIAPVVAGSAPDGSLAVRFLAGAVLLAAWVVLLQATRRSLGLGGAALAAAVTGGVIWWLIERQLVSARSGRGIANVVLIVLSLVLTVGMAWSIVSRRLTGQVDTDVTEG
jgi:hypothetical protein